MLRENCMPLILTFKAIHPPIEIHRCTLIPLHTRTFPFSKSPLNFSGILMSSSHLNSVPLVISMPSFGEFSMEFHNLLFYYTGYAGSGGVHRRTHTYTLNSLHVVACNCGLPCTHFTFLNIRVTAYCC